MATIDKTKLLLIRRDMKLINLLFLLLLVPTVITSAIWLRKDPEAIIAGQHNFFFPFLKEENIALIRQHRTWASEILAHFAAEIRQYPRSTYSQGKDPQLIEQAGKELRKAYKQLMALLGDPVMTALEQAKQAIDRAQDDISDLDVYAKGKRCGPHGTITNAQNYLQEAQNKWVVACKATPSVPPCPVVSSEHIKKLGAILAKTPAQLFGEPPAKPINMVGVQGPKLEDFQRRAHIEGVYATYMQEIQQYKTCSGLSKQNEELINNANTHLYKAYNAVLDTEGLRTKKMVAHG
jgi:hypothetical protein